MVRYMSLRLLLFAAGLGLVFYIHQTWPQLLAQAIAPLFSLGIVVLMVTELWRCRNSLSFVWATYIGNGILPYLRALAILVATIITFEAAIAVAPPFMYWGWANLVFGRSENIVLQPLNVALKAPPPTLADDGDSTPPSPLPTSGAQTPKSGAPAAVAVAIAQSNTLLTTVNKTLRKIDFSLIFLVVFWLLLILLLPFWANLEEQMFRKGAHTWGKIAVRSMLFGFAHLFAGIPILGGVVLIVPGFLFACRYKYVYDRYLQRTHNPLQAQEAGVMASTADHAVYNAILITAVVGFMIMARISTYSH